jgi:hypothetical protein
MAYPAGKRFSADANCTPPPTPVPAGAHLEISGNNLSLIPGNMVALPIPPAPVLSLTGNTLSIAGGNSVVLPVGSGSGNVSSAVAQQGSIPQFNIGTSLYEPTLFPDLLTLDGGNF